MTTRRTRGEVWAAKVREAYPLNESEELLVDMISDQIDRLDGGKMSLAERRQQENVMLRAIGQLGLPLADVGAPRPTATSQHARAAARARWAKEVER